MPKKHAMLIMAHNQLAILEKLLRMLDHERNDIYIHIDRKAGRIDENRFTSCCTHSQVYFLPRKSLHWGHSSLVECELALMQAAVDSGEDYAYMHLLSGVDLQIKTTAEIHSFFDNHPKTQFIALRNVYSGLPGMSRYEFFLPVRTYSRVLYKLLSIPSLSIQKLFRVNRLKNVKFNICKSQQWFSITGDCASYVLTQKDFIRRFVRFTSCSDEMFLGTVLVNSPFREQIYHPYRSEIGHMRLIDRNRAEGASPHTFTSDDWNMIERSPCFWARKFSEARDAGIINKVYETYKA